MGYDTNFTGEFVLDEPLAADQVAALKVFSEQRHEGDFPGIWCQWIASDDGTVIRWDEGEKFYEYTAWLEYICETFLKPWGRTITGRIEWAGEENEDIGVIHVKENRIEAIPARLVHPKPTWERT